MNYTPIQLKLPVDMERIIKINDPVYSFSEVMAHIDLKKYFVEKEHETGRPRYDREKLLKIVLFAFMEFGYCSVRSIQKLCETDIRFLWLLDEENAPSHMTINNFIHNELSGRLEDIFNDINEHYKKQRKFIHKLSSENANFHEGVVVMLIFNPKVIHRHKTVYKRTEDPISGILHLLLGCYFTAPFRFSQLADYLPQECSQNCQ